MKYSDHNVERQEEVNKSNIGGEECKTQVITTTLSQKTEYS